MPAIGAFTAFDPLMLADFKQKAIDAGHPEWELPPQNAGGYNDKTEDAAFFADNFDSDFGKFFL